MTVSPSFPTPSFPEFPHTVVPRHDAVSPSFPEFPQWVPQPVSPPSLERRGSGETERGSAGEAPYNPTATSLSAPRAHEGTLS